MSRKPVLRVGVVDPGFFFGEVFLAFEVEAGAHGGKTQFPELIHQVGNGPLGGPVHLRVEIEGFIHHRAGIAFFHSFDGDHTVEVPRARVGSLQLMLFNDRISDLK